MNATTITLFVKSLRDSVIDGFEGDNADEQFNADLPAYIDRLNAAMPAGVELEINRHDLSMSALRDDANQDLANELSHRVEFWI